MARRRKRKTKHRNHSQDLLLVLMGAVLMLCALSIFYGYRVRQSFADQELRELRIELLNGTGEHGLAARAAAALRRANVDVFEVRNADRFDYRESVLIARKKDRDLGVLAKKLGCDNVIQALVDDSIVDATLILGADYQTLSLGLRRDSGL
ncbi:MAG: LytR C-terminal domain-containing protein [Candidatus Krumholzibacteriia bacterium]